MVFVLQQDYVVDCAGTEYSLYSLIASREIEMMQMDSSFDVEEVQRSSKVLRNRGDLA